MLQSLFVPDGGSSVPCDDGGGKNGLDHRTVELDHHLCWQVKFLQPPQELHPLLGFHYDSKLRSLMMVVVPRNQSESTAVMGVSFRMIWGHWAVCFIKSTIDSSTFNTSPITVVSSANLISMTNWWSEVQQLVYRMKSRGKRTQP